MSTSSFSTPVKLNKYIKDRSFVPIPIGRTDNKLAKLPIALIANIVKKLIDEFDICVIIKNDIEDNIIDLNSIPIETKPITFIGNFFNLFVRSRTK